MIKLKELLESSYDLEDTRTKCYIKDYNVVQELGDRLYIDEKVFLKYVKDSFTFHLSTNPLSKGAIINRLNKGRPFLLHNLKNVLAYTAYEKAKKALHCRNAKDHDKRLLKHEDLYNKVKATIKVANPNNRAAEELWPNMTRLVSDLSPEELEWIEGKTSPEALRTYVKEYPSSDTVSSAPNSDYKNKQNPIIGDNMKRLVQVIIMDQDKKLLPKDSLVHKSEPFMVNEGDDPAMIFMCENSMSDLIKAHNAVRAKITDLVFSASSGREIKLLPITISDLMVKVIGIS